MWIVAYLAGIIQRGFHARIQVIQGHRLQHVEVMGHLVLHGARTVDDVLWRNAKHINALSNSPFHNKTTQLWHQTTGGDLLCKCTDGDSSCSWTQTFPANKKTKREERRVSARPVRCNDTILTQGGGTVTGADEWAEVVEVEWETLTSMTRERKKKHTLLAGTRDSDPTTFCSAPVLLIRRVDLFTSDNSKSEEASECVCVCWEREINKESLRESRRGSE